MIFCMQSQTFRSRQAICLLASFICGSSVIIGGITDGEQDSWICLLASQLFSIPVIWIYARIMWLFPEKNVYQITEYIFGKFFSKILIVIMIWYSIHLAALVLRNFSEFMQIVALTETPQLALMLIIIAVAGYMAKSGVEVLGKWAVIVTGTLILTVSFTVFLLYNQMDFTNFLPVMNHPTKDLLGSGYKLASFPFMETVVFLGMADSIRKQDKPFKIVLLGDLLGAAILLVVMLRNIVTLGPALLKAEYFPSYVAARIISISDFLVRIEGTISLNFILTGLTKITVCLMAACRGIAFLFHLEDYRKIVLPVGLFVTALCAILYQNTMQMFNFINIYEIYAALFQIVIPVLIWLGGEIKNRRRQVTIPDS